MLRKLAIYGGSILAVVLAAVTVADALVTTDEERIEAFVDAVTGDVDVNRIDSALRYLDPVREPVELTVLGETEYFDESQELELAERTRTALSPYTGTEVRLIQQHVDIEDQKAQVALRLSTPEGLVNLRFNLRRHGDGWLVRKVRVS